jgi:hypothetical protein
LRIGSIWKDGECKSEAISRHYPLVSCYRQGCSYAHIKRISRCKKLHIASISTEYIINIYLM